MGPQLTPGTARSGIPYAVNGAASTGYGVATAAGLALQVHGRPWEGKTAGVVFVVDDPVAWLVGLVAYAGRKKLTTLVLGSDQKRALRKALEAAVEATATELARIEHDVEHPEPSFAQAGEYLLQIGAGQDRLRGDEMLAGEAG
jgi:hypothetical protein